MSSQLVEEFLEIMVRIVNVFKVEIKGIMCATGRGWSNFYLNLID
jgi:hypothetical protein